MRFFFAKVFFLISMLCMGNIFAFAQQANQTVISVDANKKDTVSEKEDNNMTVYSESYTPSSSFLDNMKSNNQLKKGFLQNVSEHEVIKEKTQKDILGLQNQPEQLQKINEVGQEDTLNQNMSSNNFDNAPNTKSQKLLTSFVADIKSREMVSFVGMFFLLIFSFYMYFNRTHLKNKIDKLEEQFEKEQFGILQEMSYYQMVAEAKNEVKIIYDENNVFVLGRLPDNLELDTLNRVQNYAEWLGTSEVDKLHKSLKNLRENGDSFVLNLKTLKDKDIEVEGCLTNMRCCLWVRDVPQVKKEVKKLKSQMQNQVSMLGIFSDAANKKGLIIWVRNSKGSLVWVNEAYAVAVGIKDVKDVIARQVEILAANELSDALMALRKKHTHEITTHRNCVNGMKLYHSVSIPYDKGGSYGIAYDITDLTHAQQSLDMNEHVRDSVFDNIQSSILVFNEKKRLSFANDVFSELTGIDKNWLKEKPYANEIFDKMRENSFLPEQKDYRNWLTDLLNIETEHAVVELEWYVQNGQKLSVKKISYANVGVTFIIDNLTQSLELSGKVDALTILQTETLDNLQEAVVQFGADGRVKLCNKPFSKLFLEGMEYESEPHINDIASNPKSSIKSSGHFERLRQIVLNMEPQDEETSMIELKNGDVYKYTARFVEGGTKLVCYENQTPVLAYQKMLTEHNHILENADRVKREFMAQVSQKLREPLNNVMAYSQMLDADMYGPLNDEQAELVRLMVFQCLDFKELVDKIIDKAQIEAGNMKPQMKMASLPNLLDTTFRGIDSKLKKKQLRLNVKIPKSEINIIADPEHVSKIITHLLIESIEASPEGERILFRCHSEKDGTHFEIFDTCPFEVDEPEKSVSHFEVLAKKGKNRAENLGYQIASGLVKMHGGKISLLPSQDNGTAVEFVIPPPTPDRLH